MGLSLMVRVICEVFVDLKLAIRQDLGFIPSGNVVLSSTYVGKILGADQLLVILCYRYQESGIGYWILSMTISGSGPRCSWESNARGGISSCHHRTGVLYDRGVTEGREDVREVFQQCRSRAKRKLSKCGRNQMGNEPILAFPEGPDDFVVYYDARSKDLEAGLEKREGDCWLTNRWLSMKKVIASCGSKCLAYLEVEVEYQGSSGLLLQPELPEWGLSFEYGYASFEAWYEKECRLWVVEGLTLERCSTFGKKDKLEPSYVEPFEILGWIGPIVDGCFFSYGVVVFLIAPLRGGHELKRNMIVLAKVHGYSKRGPEFTWERKDQMRQDLGFIPSGNVVLSSTYVGKILGADQLLVILCYRYQESGIGYWILSMTISGSGVTFLPSCCNGSGVTFLPSELNGAKIERSG
ncbi:hypothetical protein Tco_0529633 [Tanacetum coccineum]